MGPGRIICMGPYRSKTTKVADKAYRFCIYFLSLYTLYHICICADTKSYRYGINYEQLWPAIVEGHSHTLNIIPRRLAERDWSLG